MTKREKREYEARLTAMRLGLHPTEPPLPSAQGVSPQLAAEEALQQRLRRPVADDPQ